ncbi:hypothetical protein L218DRAFT_857098, partial [Marasmius fiardii PR-910]
FDVLLKTAQAVNLVSGGVKINVLPELAAAIVDHRIAEHSTSLVLLPVAKEWDLSIIAFRVNASEDGLEGQVILSEAVYSALEPSPRTPVTDSLDLVVRDHKRFHRVLRAIQRIA